jgi:DNA-binding beta-propeller fold protein YncE
MQRLVFLLGLAGLLALAGCAATSARVPPAGVGAARVAEPAFSVPGPMADGSVLLPNQWSLRPVGRQVPLGDFPANLAVHPRGRWAAVLHCGYGQNEVIVVEIATGEHVCRATLDEAFYGLAFSHDGQTLVCSGAGKEVIHLFSFSQGYLGRHRTVRLREPRLRGVPAGLALSEDGARIFTANVLGHSVSVVDVAAHKVVMEIPLGTNTPAVRVKEASPARTEAELAITKREAAALLETNRTAHPFPYACALDERKARLYVSLWGLAAVAVIDVKSGQVAARWPTEEHPNEMALARSGRWLFVANANRNSVSVFDTESAALRETLVAELTPNAPPGNTPNSLALSPDEKLLFVANANINTVAVFDVSEPGRSRALGMIPVGWYPTSVRLTPDGKKLLVANGKGLISKANRHGPAPGREPAATIREYIAGLLQGTLSVIDLPKGDRFEEQLKKHTAQARLCLPAGGSESTNTANGSRARGPIPAQPGEPSPLTHVIYVIKENRTYDQVLGDLREANGDPALCLFGQEITPNHHKLAREFVLLDNFYVEGEVSADGHEWTVGAYATDFVEKTWPLAYGHNKHNKFTYPAEGNFQIAAPAGGLLWDRARQAGVSYRSYGEFVSNGKTTNQPCAARVAALDGHFDPWFRSFDMDYPDALRADRFISELRRFEREGEMPRLQIVRLPSDHTAGTTAGKRTPVACVADNDLALGRVIEAVSHSKFWPRTAIFVVEDDAQNGSDHVDAHRSLGYVISPYTRRRVVDSTMYSTCSMLRTIELILGLQPMSQFDAAARPMFSCFQARPDLRPYTHEPVKTDLKKVNLKTAWGSNLSSKMNFAQEDAADDLLLNEVIWRSVRGADSPMPPPTRAGFVFNWKKDADD